MIAPGTEWQARALSAAAEEQAGRQRAAGDVTGGAYCQGVADVLRALVGELGEAETPTQLRAILRGYSDSMD